MDTVSGSYGLSGAADTIIVLDRRAAGVVLDVRGRDVESAELAIQFSKDTCRWTVLGGAAEVHRSNERARVLAALEQAGEPLGVKDIMTAIGRTDRNAVDQLLYKMATAGEIERAGRGKYQTAGKNGKKERSGDPATDFAGNNGNLTNLTDLTRGGE
jgi:hypothetical protein